MHEQYRLLFISAEKKKKKQRETAKLSNAQTHKRKRGSKRTKRENGGSPNNENTHTSKISHSFKKSFFFLHFIL